MGIEKNHLNRYSEAMQWLVLWFASIPLFYSIFLRVFNTSDTSEGIAFLAKSCLIFNLDEVNMFVP